MKPPKPRSGVITAAQMRKGGPMRDKRMKRANESKHLDFDEDMDIHEIATKVATVTCPWIAVHHAIEMLQMHSEQWLASADAWKTLNELRESIGMKRVEPIDFPKWPEHFEMD